MPDQNEIELSGLEGSNPLAFLAACGVLRATQEIDALAGCQLYWRAEYDWLPVLRTPTPISADELVDLLAQRQAARGLEEFTWSKDIRVTPEVYRQLRGDVIAKAAPDKKRTIADFFSAFASDQVTDGSKGLVKPTAFYMVSGQQKFLDSVAHLGAALSKDAHEAFHEALFGPWCYRDEQHSLGWDPSTERLHALRERAPTKEKPRSVRGAVWFAVEALPLFPVMPRLVAGNKAVILRTTGFTRTRDKQTMFRWPIWTSPVGIISLRGLLWCRELMQESRGRKVLGARGVAAVYQSQRSEFGQGYAIFRPSSPVWSQ